MKLLPLLLLAAVSASAQQIVPDPLGHLQPRTAPEPVSPPAQHVREPRTHLSFDLPPGWNLSRRDSDLSTFALDARSALANTQMHIVATLDFNPFPYSTFSGALFYVSATPRSTALACSNQSTAPASHPVTAPLLDGIPFRHGYSEHGSSCIESRDEVYTALRTGSCLRFDLVINTFCGGEVSGARDMTPAELEAVRKRLETVLNSVHFETPLGQGTAPSSSDLLPRSPAASKQ